MWPWLCISLWPVSLPSFPEHLVQFSSVAQFCLTLCNPTDCSMPGLPVHYQLLEFTQTHVHWVGDAIQTSHPLSFLPPAFNLSQHQGLFQGVSSSHQVAKVLELQLQHQSFQWLCRAYFLYFMSKNMFLFLFLDLNDFILLSDLGIVCL